MKTYGFKNKFERLAAMNGAKEETTKIKKIKDRQKLAVVLGLTTEQNNLLVAVLKLHGGNWGGVIKKILSQMVFRVHNQLNSWPNIPESKALVEYRKNDDLQGMYNSLTPRLTTIQPSLIELTAGLWKAIKNPTTYDRLASTLVADQLAPAGLFLNPKIGGYLTLSFVSFVDRTNPEKTPLHDLLNWVNNDALQGLSFKGYKTYCEQIQNNSFGPDTVRKVIALTNVEAPLGFIGFKPDGQYKIENFIPNTSFRDVTALYLASEAGDKFIELCQLVLDTGSEVVKHSFQNFLTKCTRARYVIELCDLRYFDAQLAENHDIGFVLALYKMCSQPELLFDMLERKEVYGYLKFLEHAFTHQTAEYKYTKADNIYNNRSHQIWYLYRNELSFGNLPLKEQLEICGNIGNYTNHRAVCEWAVRHHEQLSRTVVHNANGHVYHSNSYHILNTVTPTDLTQGARTSFYKIKQNDTRRRYARQIPLEDTALPEFPLEISDTRVQQIKSSKGLLDESVKMSHCVVTYYNKCKLKRCWIFHVDDGSTNGVTVEVTLSAGNKFRIEQIQSYLSNDVEVARGIMQVELDKINLKFGTLSLGEYFDKLAPTNFDTVVPVDYYRRGIAQHNLQLPQIYGNDGIIHNLI